MINLIATILMIMALGLLGVGSIWSVPAFIAAFGCFHATDKIHVDVEFLGGLFLLLIVGAGVYAIGLQLFRWLFAAE